jgi:hypothetical protein
MHTHKHTHVFSGAKPTSGFGAAPAAGGFGAQAATGGINCASIYPYTEAPTHRANANIADEMHMLMIW